MNARILQLSDVHFAAAPGELVHGVDPDERLRAVLAAWRACGETVDLVLLTGDNTEDGSGPAYRRLAGVISALDVRTLAVAGNHDDPVRLAEFFDTTDMASVGRWRVLCIDTSRPGAIHGTVDVPKVAAALAATDGPVLIAMHHPPISRSTHPWFRLEHGEALLECLRAHPFVRGVVSGHTHEPFETIVDNGLQLLGCPSTLVGMVHDGDDFAIGGPAQTGARILELGQSGDISSRLLFA